MMNQLPVTCNINERTYADAVRDEIAWLHELKRECRLMQHYYSTLVNYTSELVESEIERYKTLHASYIGFEDRLTTRLIMLGDEKWMDA